MLLLRFLSLHSLLNFEPLSSFPGRPIPPTSSSSLLPSAQLPSSHNPPPVSCQMPLLDSNTSHQIMDTNPDEEFSPNSYLLRACSGPQQTSSSGINTTTAFVVVVVVVVVSRKVVSNPLQPHGQHFSRPSCPPRSPGVHSSSHQLLQ
ncbi:Teneurin-2 [Varanus komodoensis]|nr:Teneurin-2 [Varanus komodoensis]